MRKCLSHFGQTLRLSSRSFFQMICRQLSHFTHRPSVRTFFSPEVSSSPDSRLNQAIDSYQGRNSFYKLRFHSVSKLHGGKVTPQDRDAFLRVLRGRSQRTQRSKAFNRRERREIPPSPERRYVPFSPADKRPLRRGPRFNASALCPGPVQLRPPAPISSAIKFEVPVHVATSTGRIQSTFVEARPQLARPRPGPDFRKRRLQNIPNSQILHCIHGCHATAAHHR